MSNKDEKYMEEALKQAEEAGKLNEVPVGAVIVYEDKIIARAHNQTRLLRDPTAHAEMIAITQATNYLQDERLLRCDIYVTIEPCPMCAGAIVLARVNKLFYGVNDPKSGACGSIINITNHSQLNHKVKVKGGVLKKECSMLLRDFFKDKRTRNK